MLTLGSLTLDNDPYVNIAYNYNQTSNGRVVGGKKNITLSGSIYATNSSNLMAEANKIKNWFAQSSNRFLSNVTINNQTYQYVSIESVSVDSTDWVSSIEYTINLTAKIEASAVLPTNILSLTYNDYVDSLDISESLEISSESNGNYYLANGSLATLNNSVKWTIKISVKCYRSSGQTPSQNAKNLLQKILITTPDRQEFQPYKSWTLYLQTRNISTNASQGTIDFNCSAVLMPPQISNASLINIKSTTDHSYLSNSHNKTINCSVTGMAAIPWSSIIDLNNTCFLTTRFTNAVAAVNSLVSIYKDIDNFPGREITATELNCPIYCNILSSNICYKPKNININKSSDGTASVDMQWSSDGSNCSSGYSIEVEETINNIDQTIVENNNYWITNPIITNLNCRKARVLSYNINVTGKYKCPQASLYNAAWNEYNTIVNNLDSSQWYEIKKTSTENNNSYSINVDFVEGC